MNSILKTLPREINIIINEYLYEPDDVLKKYHKKWKELNVRILVLFDMMYSPYNCHCFYYLTLYDFNNKPCWLCGDQGHPMKICANYYFDIARLKKIIKLN